MRYTDDFEGRSRSETNAPWEISPRQAWREQFFHREVDPLAQEERDSAARRKAAAKRRAEAEADRAQREEAHEAEQAQRKETHAAFQAQREEAHKAAQAKRREAHAAAQARRKESHAAAQAQHEELPAADQTPPGPNPEAEPPRPPAVPVPEDDLFDEEDDDEEKPAKKKHHVLFWVLLVALIVVGTETVIKVVQTFSGISTGVYYDDGDSDFFYYYSEGDEDSEEAEEQTYELPAYTGDSSDLSITLVSSEGKTALTYQELYAQCLPYMVSITVTAGTTGGTGSGIILAEDGYILTCNHVVADSATCTVLTYDDVSYTATLVGSDAQTDLAVLKIEATGLTPAEFGDSDELQVGDEALVIGDPLGSNFRGSLTNGIISGVNRSVSSNGYAMTLIQTTAAVNSGNSGGALFNIYGQVVGVVNLKMVTSSSSSSSATVEGMGMAVPSTTVESIVSQLANDGAVHRAALGISCTSISEATSAITGIPEGLMVQYIYDASDCAAQGIQLYDLITAANGTPVSTVQEFKEVIADLEIGDTVTLTVYRDVNQSADEEDGADSSVAAESEAASEYEYDYQYYGEITVTLIDSLLME
ncbi:MAG: trypsin-like peptidase domain-containing protein [Clostridiales bacterium]|nr:trypsin-like peptidase domain-containing protein [Clostridiales bacterium]